MLAVDIFSAAQLDFTTLCATTSVHYLGRHHRLLIMHLSVLLNVVLTLQQAVVLSWCCAGPSAWIPYKKWVIARAFGHSGSQYLAMSLLFANMTASIQWLAFKVPSPHQIANAQEPIMHRQIRVHRRLKRAAVAHYAKCVPFTLSSCFHCY